MSENLIENVAPHLTAPVSREPVQSAGEAQGGTAPSIAGITIGPITFADEDAD